MPFFFNWGGEGEKENIQRLHADAYPVDYFVRLHSKLHHCMDHIFLHPSCMCSVADIFFFFLLQKSEYSG